MNLDVEKFKLEREQALSKVGQMESIKKIMDHQLSEGHEEMVKYRTKTENLDKQLNKERITFEDNLKKSLKDYETQKI